MRIVFIGDPGTGKTSTLEKIRNDPIDCYGLTLSDEGSLQDADACVLFGTTNRLVWASRVLEASPNAKLYRYTNYTSLRTLLRRLSMQMLQSR